MQLIVDIGNSHIKATIFEQNVLKGDGYTILADEEALIQLGNEEGFNHILICTVRLFSEKLQAWVGSNAKIAVFTPETKVPITNRYATPHTLGLDRLAAAVGATELYSDDSVLIIDAGSCITYDIVTADKVFLGGAISPGTRMRFRAMNHFTGKLPLIQFEGRADFDLIGDNTIACMESGVFNGVLAEVNYYSSAFLVQYPQGKIVITGGDTNFLQKSLKISTFAQPNLVAIGLNKILNYNTVH